MISKKAEGWEEWNPVTQKGGQFVYGFLPELLGGWTEPCGVKVVVWSVVDLF